MKIGVLGNGQLGQMLEQSVTDLTDIEISLYDLRAHDDALLAEFLKEADIVTFETENIPDHIVSLVEPVKDKTLPGIDALKTFQNRLLEKRALRNAGIATADFAAVTSLDELEQAVDSLGLPVVLKTTTAGYDGKGQFLIRSRQDVEKAWQAIGGRELIAEAFVPFVRETSIIASRDRQGHMVIWPMTDNMHHRGMLRYSLYPAQGLSQQKMALAEQYIRSLAEHFDYVGTITLELFETADGLIANEVAPRVHNSGHWSIEGAEASQFRNHILALAGQKLEPAAAIYPAVAMLNVIGDEQPAVIADGRKNVYRHSYGKEARPERKLGHITIVADSVEQRDLAVAQLAVVIPAEIRDQVM
ncbi:5-(carboxyamino)imidazole ribonucleotide synthase [Spongorhabdus nitratireducens]